MPEAPAIITIAAHVGPGFVRHFDSVLAAVVQDLCFLVIILCQDAHGKQRVRQLTVALAFHIGGDIFAGNVR